MILTVFFDVLENVYLSERINEFVFPLTTGVGGGLAGYLGAKLVLGYGSKNVDKYIIRGAVIDEYLSREYSNDSQRLTGKDPEIYRMLYPDPLRKWSPAFTVLGKNLRIVVSFDFFLRLQLGEKRALILHEIYHYIHKDLIFIYSLSLIFLLSIVAFLVLVIYGVEFGITGTLFMLFLIFISLSIGAIILLKVQLIWQEYRSDRCTAMDMKTNSDIKTAIVKASEYAKFQTSEKKYERIESLMKRRLKHLE